MRIKNRKLSLLWKAMILAFGLWGLLDGAGILAGHYTQNFPHMFTNISNLAAWLYFACALLRKIGKRGHGDSGSGEIFAPTFKYTVTVSLLVTMLIGHFMVFDAMFQGGHIVWHLVVLHYIIPVMVLLDWLLFDEKGRMPVWGPLSWVSLALGYLVFTMIGVGVFGLYMGGGTTAELTPYPYVFLDPAIAGPGAVAGFCSAMLAGFGVLGYIMYGADKLMGQKAHLTGNKYGSHSSF